MMYAGTEPARTPGVGEHAVTPEPMPPGAPTGYPDPINQNTRRPVGMAGYQGAAALHGTPMSSAMNLGAGGHPNAAHPTTGGAAKFSFRPRGPSKINWRLLHSLDLDSVIRDGDVDQIQHHMENMMFARFDQDDLHHCSDDQLLKLVHLMQFQMEFLYVMYSASQTVNHQVMERLHTLTEDSEQWHRKAEEQRSENNRLKKELREKKKHATFLEALTKFRHAGGDSHLLPMNTVQNRTPGAANSQKPTAGLRCGICGKRFETEETLMSHIVRRHPTHSHLAGALVQAAKTTAFGKTNDENANANVPQDDQKPSPEAMADFCETQEAQTTPADLRPPSVAQTPPLGPSKQHAKDISTSPLQKVSSSGQVDVLSVHEIVTQMRQEFQGQVQQMDSRMADVKADLARQITGSLGQLADHHRSLEITGSSGTGDLEKKVESLIEMQRREIDEVSQQKNEMSQLKDLMKTVLLNASHGSSKEDGADELSKTLPIASAETDGASEQPQQQPGDVKQLQVLREGISRDLETWRTEVQNWTQETRGSIQGALQEFKEQTTQLTGSSPANANASSVEAAVSDGQTPEPQRAAPAAPAEIIPDQVAEQPAAVSTGHDSHTPGVSPEGDRIHSSRQSEVSSASCFEQEDIMTMLDRLVTNEQSAASPDAAYPNPGFVLHALGGSQDAFNRMQALENPMERAEFLLETAYEGDVKSGPVRDSLQQFFPDRYTALGAAAVPHVQVPAPVPIPAPMLQVSPAVAKPIAAQSRSPNPKRDTKAENGELVTGVFRGAFAGLLDQCNNGAVPASQGQEEEAVVKAAAAAAAKEALEEPLVEKLKDKSTVDASEQPADPLALASQAFDSASGAPAPVAAPVPVPAPSYAGIPEDAPATQHGDAGGPVHIWSDTAGEMAVVEPAAQPVQDWSAAVVSQDAGHPVPPPADPQAYAQSGYQWQPSSSSNQGQQGPSHHETI